MKTTKFRSLKALIAIALMAIGLNKVAAQVTPSVNSSKGDTVQTGVAEPCMFCEDGGESF